MRDLKLIDPTAPRIPEEWRREYLQRPDFKLREDVNLLYDRNWKLERDKDEFNARLMAAQGSLRTADLKIWILGAVVSSEFAIIGWLVKEFLAATR